VQQKVPGDKGVLVLSRGGEVLTLEVTFRSAEPAGHHK